MGMLRVPVAVGVGWVERNNKASSGLQSTKFDENEIWPFLGEIFRYKSESPQPSIVALQRKLKWVDSEDDCTLSTWRGPIAAQHADSMRLDDEATSRADKRASNRCTALDTTGEILRS
jgi:hypothetical protein